MSTAIAAAIRARPGLFLVLSGGLVLLSIALPPILLSIVRKPWTYFTFNPWLQQLPAYLASGRPLGEKLDFLSRAALFWFSADGPYGAPEWGFAVDTLDLARMLGMGLLVATYFCLLLRARDRGRPDRPPTSGYRRGGASEGGKPRSGAVPGGAGPGGAAGGGVLGTLVAVLGLSTGPCSVVGCGAPVLPVVGLAFAGLSSGTLALMSGLSRAMALAVAAVLVLGVLRLAWLTRPTPSRPAPPPSSTRTSR
jgi:hypothetical protein